jgi:DNA-binding response OmpR family regulator
LRYFDYRKGVMDKHVVILEDDKATLEMVESILSEEGYFVSAINHYKPLDFFIEFEPDLVLLDIRLKDGYGHLLCKELKASPQTSHIPVILASGADNLEAIAKECHADGFISKPYSMDDLLALVKHFYNVKSLLNDKVSG